MTKQQLREQIADICRSGKYGVAETKVVNQIMQSIDDYVREEESGIMSQQNKLQSVDEIIGAIFAHGVAFERDELDKTKFNHNYLTNSEAKAQLYELIKYETIEVLGPLQGKTLFESKRQNIKAIPLEALNKIFGVQDD